jgi:hypothetical protein
MVERVKFILVGLALLVSSRAVAQIATDASVLVLAIDPRTPTSLFAGMFGFLPRTFFDLGEGRAQLEQAPSVKF